MLPHYTQFSSGQKEETHTVVIGLDFGTSSSKVVINNQTVNVAFAIPFNKFGHPSNKYLFPTRPYFDHKGNLCLSSVNDCMPLRELKATLMDKNPKNFDFDNEKELEATAELLTMAYLAQVIRLARQWYLANQLKAFGNAKISWQLNIGVPSVGKGFDAKKSFFKKLATGAWLLSTEHGNITIEGAKETYKELNNSTFTLIDIHSDDINALPEVVAEVIGYARSDERNNGLHFLIDIGASTVDISSFVLGLESGSDRYSILTGDVGWLGAFELHKYRIKNIKNRIAEWLDHLGKNEDPVSPIPTHAAGYLPDSKNLNIKRDREIDSYMFNACCQLIKKTVIEVRQKRDPKSPKWKSGIPVFICGGGSQISFYNDAIKSASDFLVSCSLSPLKPFSLPKPNNLQIGSLDDNEFHRLAVAYGLSFPEYDMGTIYPPDEIEDVQKTHRSDFSGRFVDKDHV